jgi:Na+/H+ antiporter NhaC
MGGSVFGDHCSPISDTTILASTGAGCNHLDHVTTQTPYAMLVAAVCFTGYIIVGLVNHALGYAGTAAIVLPLILAMLIAALVFFPKLKKTGL